MMEDKNLITSLVYKLNGREGEKAFGSLCDIYYKKLKRYLRLFVKDEMIVKELLSDVFLAVWQNRGAIYQPESFNTYIYRIAKYKAINFLNSKKHPALDIDNLPVELFKYAVTKSPEESLITSEEINNINSAIESLPDKCKMAFKLVREDKMSYRDAADLMEISVGTLNTHIYKAVKTIKAKLTEESQS